MHLTWQAGDPVVQLDFPNPLNVSVQLGDIAYFSNPTPVGIDGIPELVPPYNTTVPPTPTPSGEQWTPTTTPHLTNEQQHIKMIGEIVQIIPWDGTVSSIFCNMPQDLFNQYFTEIVGGGCADDTSSPPLSNTCDGLTIYETVEEILDVAFSAGNYSTFYQFIGVTGTSTLTGNSVFDTQNTCDGMKLLHPFSNPDDPFDHTGGLSAAQTLDHWINDHGVTTLSPTSSYADFKSVIMGGQDFGHQFNPGLGLTGSKAPCRCTYSEACTQGSFIMFSKDNKVNMSSILGYYASVEFRNSSKIKSEIFNVGTDFFESSK